MRHLETFLHLEEINLSDDNFKNYRDLVKTVRFAHEPVFPYMGLILKDLTFTEDANPTMKASSSTSGSVSHINFKKMRMLANIYREFCEAQESLFLYPILPGKVT